MIAIDKQPPPLSIKIAKHGTKLAKLTTINGLILITLILLQQWLLPWIPIDIVLLPLAIFLVLTTLTIITTITALLIAAFTGHLTETWETITQ